MSFRVLNYGFIGSIYGHELIHGFDNTGRKSDHMGNVNMWWKNETIKEYEKRADCFIKHYESYSIPGTMKKVFLYYLIIYNTYSCRQ